MKKIVQCLQHPLSLPLAFSILMIMTVGASSAQAASQVAPATPVARITAEISNSKMVALPATKHPLALAQFDTGRVAAGTKLQGMSVYFSRSLGQEADLKGLMAAQQNPASSLYHQWLTPQQFGSRFGMPDADIAKVESWLEQQGFAIDSVANNKSMIRFSGTVGQVESAFATELHTYALKTPKGVENHFAPSTALSVPSALAGVVEGIHNMDDFRPKSHVVVNKASRAKPKYTIGNGSNAEIFFAPGDIATVYDLQKEYNASFTGTGQTIAIVGQSAVSDTDLEAFWSAAGITRQDPAMNLVTGSGTSTVQADGDETESDLDLEWSGAIAKGASLAFVYTGNNTNFSTFDSIQFAIDNKIGTIISSSYGNCEANLAGFSLETAFDQAATQGQTVMSAAGDSGSTDCFEIPSNNVITAQDESLAVDYPGSSPNVTSVGGTEISQASSNYETVGNGYWEAASSSTSTLTTSALQYIPEQAWNEDVSQGLFIGCSEDFQQDPVSGSSPLCAGGGGASSLFPSRVTKQRLPPRTTNATFRTWL